MEMEVNLDKHKLVENVCDSKQQQQDEHDNENDDIHK